MSSPKKIRWAYYLRIAKRRWKLIVLIIFIILYAYGWMKVSEVKVPEIVYVCSNFTKTLREEGHNCTCIPASIRDSSFVPVNVTPLCRCYCNISGQVKVILVTK